MRKTKLLSKANDLKNQAELFEKLAKDPKAHKEITSRYKMEVGIARRELAQKRKQLADWINLLRSHGVRVRMKALDEAAIIELVKNGANTLDQICEATGVGKLTVTRFVKKMRGVHIDHRRKPKVLTVVR